MAAVSSKDVKEIIVRLDVCTSQLEDQLRRTVLLEAGLEAQRKYFEYRQSALDSRMDRQEAQVNGLPVRLIQYVSILSGIIAALKLIR
jgi:hypothetical protein